MAPGVPGDQLSLEEGFCLRVSFKRKLSQLQLITWALWEDPELLQAPARTEDEARYLVIGMIDDKHWSCVVTYRDERVRIVSARRSRNGEVSLYES